MSKPVTVTSTTFPAEVFASDVPVVVDFWAAWCGPCRMLGPVLEDMAEKFDGKVKVAKVDTESERELAAAFNVSGIPHMAILYKGMVIGSYTGFPGPAGTEELFKNVLKAQEELDQDKEFLAKAAAATAQRATA